MKSRYLYVLMYSLPILLASLVIAASVVGAAAGLIWVTIAGDNSWPLWVSFILVILFVITFSVSLLTLVYQVYAFGKAQEIHPSACRWHARGAITASLLMMLVIIAYQWLVGNIGPKSTAVQCSEFCIHNGFVGSALPPRDEGAAACSCFDEKGKVVKQVPIEKLLGPAS